MIFRLILLVLCVGAFLGTLFVRLSPIADRHFASRAGDDNLGGTPSTGGHRVVVPQPGVDELTSLLDAIEATPRTTEVSTDHPDTRIFVHRSRVWGFPDVTHIILTDDRLIIDSHLVFGKSDLGVNKARMERWLALIQG